MTRDAKLITLCAVLATLCAGVVVRQVAFAPPPAVDAVQIRVSPGSDEVLSIQFVGDTMLGDAALPALKRHGYDWPFRRQLRRALDGDYVIANLETAVTARKKPYNPGKEYSYHSEAAAVQALKLAGIDAFDMDNNHAMDAGPPGLADTFTALHDAGVVGFGAGQNVARAEQPLLIRSSAGTVAVVGLGENFGSSIRAATDQAGTLVLSPETVQRGVDLARAAGADWVIAYVHWGDNYTDVNSQQRYWAKLMVDAGYDLVIGAGPHVAQPIDFIDGVPIVYSVGNFVFGSPGRFKDYGLPGVGLMVTAQLNKETGVQLEARCLVTDNDHVHFRPRLCSHRQSVRILRDVNPRITMSQDTGLLSVASSAR